MLRANRRLLRPGGRLAFFVIELATGLDRRARRRAAAAGPPSVATRSAYDSMLATAGFVEIERVDVTTAYRSTVMAWNQHYRDRAAELSAIWGADVVADKVATAPKVARAVDDGSLRRALYLARRPG